MFRKHLSRKYLGSDVARALGQSEATVRKRQDLPVVEVLPDGTRVYDASAIDLMRLEKAMRCEGLGVLNRRALVEKFCRLSDGGPG